MEKERNGSCSKATTSSVRYGRGSVRDIMAASGSGSLVIIDDVTADRSSRRNSKVYRSILSALIQPNAAKLIHTAKATRELLKAKQWNIPQ